MAILLTKTYIPSDNILYEDRFHHVFKFSNDRNHMLILREGDSPEEVASALEGVARAIRNDENLR